MAALRRFSLFALTICLGVIAGLGSRNASSFDSAVNAIQVIGFSEVAFLIISMGLGSVILWAVGYFIARLDKLGDKIADGQNRTIEQNGMLINLITAVREDLHILIQFISSTQSAVIATQARVAETTHEVQEHRSTVEHEVDGV